MVTAEESLSSLKLSEEQKDILSILLSGYLDRIIDLESSNNTMAKALEEYKHKFEIASQDFNDASRHINSLTEKVNGINSMVSTLCNNFSLAGNASLQNKQLQ